MRRLATVISGLLLLVSLSTHSAYSAGPPTLGVCRCYRMDNLWWVALHTDGVWTASTVEGWHWAGRWKRLDGGIEVVESRVGESSRRYPYHMGWDRLSLAKGPFPPAR